MGHPTTRMILVLHLSEVQSALASIYYAECRSCRRPCDIPTVDPHWSELAVGGGNEGTRGPRPRRQRLPPERTFGPLGPLSASIYTVHVQSTLSIIIIHRDDTYQPVLRVSLSACQPGSLSTCHRVADMLIANSEGPLSARSCPMSCCQLIKTCRTGGGSFKRTR